MPARAPRRRPGRLRLVSRRAKAARSKPGRAHLPLADFCAHLSAVPTVPLSGACFGPRLPSPSRRRRPRLRRALAALGALAAAAAPQPDGTADMAKSSSPAALPDLAMGDAIAPCRSSNMAR